MLAVFFVFKIETVGSKFKALPITLLKEFSNTPLESNINALVFTMNFNLEDKSKFKLAVKLDLVKLDLSLPPTIPPWFK